MPEGRVFILQPYGRKAQSERKYYAVIVPQVVSLAAVQAAWSYVVRYTAKGLDLPDHDAAANLLKERHPSWEIIAGEVYTASVDLNTADNDQPET